MSAATPRRKPRVVLEPMVRGVAPTPARPRLTEELINSPITRVEWDALKATGSDPAERFSRVPAEQRTLPQAVTDGGWTRIRVGSNVSVLR